MAAPIKPARGVDLALVLRVTGVLAALGAAVITAGVLSRRGRLPAVDRFVAGVEARTGMPAWTAVPTAVSGLSLLTAGFGFYWDVAVHIDNGRDQNPFGTPAHWPIVIGLCGLVVAGMPHVGPIIEPGTPRAEAVLVLLSQMVSAQLA